MVRLRTGLTGADDLPRILGVDPSTCVVVRCYWTTARDGASRLCAVMVRAGDTADPAALLDALDCESVRPATAAEVNSATDYAAALVSPVCLPDDLLLLADSALGGSDVLYATTGEHGVALGIRTRDLLVATNARVTSLTARPLANEEWSGWPVGAGLETAAARVVALSPSRRGGARRTTDRGRGTPRPVGADGPPGGAPAAVR